MFGKIDGEEREYGKCDFEVAERIAEPKKSIRGDIARFYFYMSHQYKMKILDDYDKILREYDLFDPPDKWERQE